MARFQPRQNSKTHSLRRDMPRTFDKVGVRFQYPDNWSLDESESVDGGRSMTLYSVQGGFWSLSIHPPTASPEELVKAAVEAMRQEYPDMDVEDVTETVGKSELIGADLNFFYLDLTSTANIRGYRTPSATYVIFCQAEDRDYAVLEPVFRAITLSLLS